MPGIQRHPNYHGYDLKDPAFADFYNRARAHQGYRIKGRTPYQAFLDGVNEMTQERVT